MLSLWMLILSGLKQCHGGLMQPTLSRLISHQRHPSLMWKRKRCQAPDRMRNQANRPQSRFNRGLVASLTRNLSHRLFIIHSCWCLANGLSKKLAAPSQEIQAWAPTGRRPLLRGPPEVGLQQQKEGGGGDKGGSMEICSQYTLAR